MTERKTATTEAQYADYVVHTLSCRTCWADRTQCPTAKQLTPWREARR